MLFNGRIGLVRLLCCGELYGTRILFERWSVATRVYGYDVLIPVLKKWSSVIPIPRTVVPRNCGRTTCWRSRCFCVAPPTIGRPNWVVRWWELASNYCVCVLLFITDTPKLPRFCRWWIRLGSVLVVLFIYPMFLFRQYYTSRKTMYDDVCIGRIHHLRSILFGLYDLRDWYNLNETCSNCRKRNIG